jgi:nitroimidazol reductase NimA-like FMN-containing flavoprotein (pyridoxamine 5'-phosphate oxidase superfamily)
MPDRVEPTPAERAAQGAAIVDRISYMVLASADPDGRPWATPVYFATAGSGAFYWVSSHEARHSANIAARPDVGIVVFDSTVPISTGQTLIRMFRATAASYSMLAKDGQPDHRVAVEFSGSG